MWIEVFVDVLVLVVGVLIVIMNGLGRVCGFEGLFEEMWVLCGIVFDVLIFVLMNGVIYMVDVMGG